MKIGDIVYRYETYRGFHQTYLELDKYTITHLTPCGYWVRVGWKAKGKWINSKTRRRFAYPTKEEALNAYQFRKQAFMRHAKRMLEFAEHDLSVIETPGQKEAALSMGRLQMSKICSVTTTEYPTLNLF